MKIEQAVRSVFAGLAAGLALRQTEAPSLERKDKKPALERSSTRLQAVSTSPAV